MKRIKVKDNRRDMKKEIMIIKNSKEIDGNQ